MTYRPGYHDFFHKFRDQECIIVFKKNDPADWWIAPLKEDGSEEDGGWFDDLTMKEEDDLSELVHKAKWDLDNDFTGD